MVSICVQFNIHWTIATTTIFFAIFKAFSSIKNGAQSLNQQAPFKNLIFLKKDDEKTKEEITEASSLLYDYKRHEYTANKEKMLVVELYDSKNSNN